jgi:uncharacterized membrane protein YgcG
MIDVFDKNLKKINTIRKYTLAQYVDKFREIGTFKILAQFVDENLYLLSDEQFYILFDGRIFGRVDKVLKDSDSEYDKTIEITGQLAPIFFTQRVNYKTITYKGTTAKYVGALISHNIPTDKTDPRYLKINVLYDNESYLDANCRQIERTKTGGYMWDEMQLALEQDNLGIFFEPDFTTIGQTISDDDGVQIDAWKLVISAGTDRTRGNDKGNTPIIFSQNISNIQRSTYALQSEDYCNSAVVAGEGEGDARKWFTFDINTKEKKFEAAHGFGLRELYIDARDVQSKGSDNTTMTDAEYEQELRKRADSKAVDAMLAKAYSSTVITSDERYVYNRDYYKGDIVTVVDNELAIRLDAQITSVTKTYQGVKEIIDIDFTYGKTEADLFGSSTSKGSAANTAAKVGDIADDIEITRGDIGKISDDMEITKGDIDDIKQQLESGGGTGTKNIVVGGKDNNEGTFTQKNDNNEEILKIDKAGFYGVQKNDDVRARFFALMYAAYMSAISVEATRNEYLDDDGINIDRMRTMFANDTVEIERKIYNADATESSSKKRKSITTLRMKRPTRDEASLDKAGITDYQFDIDFSQVTNFRVPFGQLYDETGFILPVALHGIHNGKYRMGWDDGGLYIQSQYGTTITDKHYFVLTDTPTTNTNPSGSGSSSGSDGGHQSGGHQVGGSSSDGGESSSGRPQGNTDDGTE